MSDDISGRLDLQTLCETLVEEYETTYIAAREQTLADQSPVLLFHTPAGTQRISDLHEDLANRFENAERIRVGGAELPFALRHVLHSEVHAFRRVPIYVDAQLGLDDVALEEGIERARKFVVGETEPTPPASESIALPTLVRELATAGATAVELRNDRFIDHDIVDLRIPMIPAKGYPIAGPYDAVTFDGESYDFQFECVLDGPGGYGQMRTPLYVDSSTVGLSTVSLEDGVDNFETLQAVVQKAGTHREAYKRLREASTEWTVGRR